MGHLQQIEMWQVYLALVSFILTLFLLNLVINLRSLHRLGRDKADLLGTLPFISVLIPARNEASVIGECLESLCRQDYPNYEILVLDDSSSDATAAVVDRIAATEPRVQLLHGRPLAPGWAGKPFACQQLAAAARGEWLLFTDADTKHEPRMLRATLDYARKEKLSMISGFPRQQTVSISQRVAMPAIYFLILSCLPLWFVQRSRKPKPGLAIGQFLFMHAGDYREIGGHEAVRGRILEDVWMGFEMVRHGKRHAMVDLSLLVSCRMYDNFGDLWRGFAKWIYSITSVAPWSIGILVAGVTGLFIAPFVMLFFHYTPVPMGPYEWSKVIVLQVIIVLIMRILIDRRFRHSRFYSFSHPLGISFMLASGAYGSFRRFTGAGVEWKARTYKSDSDVS